MTRSDWRTLLGLLLFALLIRGLTFTTPVIGFDEQFYLLVGDQMVHNHALPFVDIFDRKPIGLFLIFGFVRLFGGDGFLQYKLVALLWVVASAFLITRTARTYSSPRASLAAGALYILMLNFMEGEGGQAEIFLNLPVLMAGLLVWRAWETEERIITRGAIAMLLMGVALQIKYTALFEGIFFGLALLWALWSAQRRFTALLLPAVIWIAIALAPTTLAYGVYVVLGHGHEFLFANFLSLFGRNGETLFNQIIPLDEIVGLLLPLSLLAFLGLRRKRLASPFLIYWIFASLFGILAFGSFLSPHYAMPLLAPLCLASALFFSDVNSSRPVFLGILGILSLLALVVLDRIVALKGSSAQAYAVARAATPHSGCIFVYDGYPALYMLTHSCLPSRWVFPGHYNTQIEDSEKALGISPEAELTRILNTQPPVIVDDWPVNAGGNARTRALLQVALAHDYHLAARIETGTERFRMVYKHN